MAKRRKKRAGKRRTRTVTVHKTRRVYVKRARRRRGGGRSHSSGLMPSRDEMYDMGAAAVFGLAERKAKADQSFILNTLAQKSPVPQIGFAGNVAVAARLVNRFAFHHPMLGRFARVTAQIAAYQIARQGSLFTSVAPFTVSGEWDDDQLAGDLDVGALAADADAHEIEGYDDDDAMSGLDDEMVDNIDEGQ
jgi:hypothetical protein